MEHVTQIEQQHLHISYNSIFLKYIRHSGDTVLSTVVALSVKYQKWYKCCSFLFSTIQSHVKRASIHIRPILFHYDIFLNLIGCSLFSNIESAYLGHSNIRDNYFAFVSPDYDNLLMPLVILLTQAPFINLVFFELIFSQ